MPTKAHELITAIVGNVMQEIPGSGPFHALVNDYIARLSNEKAQKIALYICNAIDKYRASANQTTPKLPKIGGM